MALWADQAFQASAPITGALADWGLAAFKPDCTELMEDVVYAVLTGETFNVGAVIVDPNGGGGGETSHVF